MKKLWIWATVAAIGLGTTATAAYAESKLNQKPPQQKRSQVSHSKHAPAKPAAKKSIPAVATKKVAKSAAKPQAKKAIKAAAKPVVKQAAKHESKPTKGRLAKRHS